MQIDRIENGFQIDAEALGPLLGVPAEDVQFLMRKGQIATVCEEGQGEDKGRHRITFRYGAIRLRLTLDESGEVLLRTRTAVAPHPNAADRLAAGRSGARRPEPAQPTDEGRARLTRKIEARHHERHRQRLRDLGKLAEMVEDLHEGEEGVPAGLHQALLRLRSALESHIRLAQTVVYPAVRSGTASDLAPWVEALRDDHTLFLDLCGRIREITGDFHPPYGACTSWATLYAGLSDFVDELQDYIRLEKDLLVHEVQESGL